MKKTISIFACALMLLVGVTSCNKDNSGQTTGDTGSLEVIFDFSTLAADESAGTKAVSTAKPTTSWNTNVKDLLILCVNSSGVVKYARNILPLPTGAALTTPALPILTGIPEGVYTVYAIANAQQTADIVSSFAGVTGTWNEGLFIGRSITNALLKLKTTTATSGVLLGQTAYAPPAEIFVGSASGVNIASTTATTSVSLTRAISLMRVRIDQRLNGNNTVDFAATTPSKGAVHIRRATQQWTLGGYAIPLTGQRVATNEIFVNSAFKTADPASGYSPSAMNLGTEYSCWADIMMFPGGSADVRGDMFDILISGSAPANYVSQEGTPVAAGTILYWSGQVDGAAVANGILEVNCTLKAKGSTIVPPVGTYGDLTVTVSLKDWGAIAPVEVPM